jgi:hypothetical protein
MSTLTAPSLTSRTIQAILPAASIGTAIDGGLGYYDLIAAEVYAQDSAGQSAPGIVVA